MGGDSPVITHLQFADDTVVFCKADIEEVKVIKRVLRCFEVVSGLKINFSKSIASGVGLEGNVGKEIAEVLRCKRQNLPIKYLGLYLGASSRKVKTWEGVINNFRNKLAGWKNKFLSFGGRVTLIKSVLSSLLLYYMSIFKIPRKVTDELDKIQSRFLWGSSETRRKVHLVNWERVCMSKERGGLGVKRVKDMNDSLLMKWWWRYGKEENAMWRRIIAGKYGEGEFSWLPNVEECKKGSRIWKDILKVGMGIEALGEHLKSNVKIVLGDGSRTWFWKDMWAGEVVLKLEFPRLYSLATNKGACVKDCYTLQEGSVVWRFSFRRSLRGWEEEERLRLLQLLGEGVNLVEGKEDTIAWKMNSLGKYSVKEFYDWRESSRGQSFKLEKMVWKNSAPLKVQCFAWLVAMGRVKTT